MRQRFNPETGLTPPSGVDTGRIKQLRENPKLTREALHEHVAKLTKHGRLTSDVREALKEAKVLHGNRTLTKQQYMKAMGSTLMALKSRGVRLTSQAEKMVTPLRSPRSAAPSYKLRETALREQFKSRVKEEIKVESAKKPSSIQMKEFERHVKRVQAMKMYNIRQTQEQRTEEAKTPDTTGWKEDDTTASATEGDDIAASSEEAKKPDAPGDGKTASGTPTTPSGGSGATTFQGGGVAATVKQVSGSGSAQSSAASAIVPPAANQDEAPVPTPVVHRPRTQTIVTLPDAVIAGRSEPGMLVTVLFEGTMFDQVRLRGLADASGDFSIPLTQDVPLGDHTIQVVAARPVTDVPAGASSNPTALTAIRTGVPSLPTAPIRFKLMHGATQPSDRRTSRNLDDELPL